LALTFLLKRSHKIYTRTFSVLSGKVIRTFVSFLLSGFLLSCMKTKFE
jgi:hypothetical protein